MLNTPYVGGASEEGTMIPEHSEQLAKRVINTWRLTPQLREWDEALRPLGYEQAVKAFHALRASVDGSLSIARFLAEVEGEERRRHAPPQPRPDCPDCGGEGFRDQARELAHRPELCRGDPTAPWAPGPAACHCTAVERCPCARRGAA